MNRTRAVFWSLLLLLSCVRPATAQTCSAARLVEFGYTPTAHAQVAIWIEQPDGTFMGTVALTEAVALRGIGNRPGAQQMVSSFRYPYGRRESALPVWAHRRALAPGASQFRRVIFQDRAEGRASRTTVDSTYDSYFCLSFTLSDPQSARDSLDGVTCPSMQDSNIDKGRYITATDVANGYFEPFETGGTTMERLLGLDSLYPPRRDLDVTYPPIDTADTALYASDALAVMPDLDTVTMATPAGEVAQSLLFSVPSDWPDGDYVAFVETNVEGDYNQYFNDTTYPGPSDTNYWDTWAIYYGYPYIGQPSVVYSIPFTLNGIGQTVTATFPDGYGDVYGQAPMLNPMDGKITDDPVGAPGSGADRLRKRPDGTRVAVQTFPTNLCGDPSANPICQQTCTTDAECPSDYRCGSNATCEGYCDDCTLVPNAPIDFQLEAYPDPREAYHYARMTFVAPDNVRTFRYEARVSRQPIQTEDDYMAAQLAKRPTIAAEALVIPTDDPPGTTVTVDFGGLAFQTRYYVAIRTIDTCNYRSPFVTGEIETTAIKFNTVTPCFVATAAYGTPLAQEVGVLRRFRDRHLLSNPLGEALVAAYYGVGPEAAEIIRDHGSLRAATRATLEPVVDLVRRLLGEAPEIP